MITTTEIGTATSANEGVDEQGNPKISTTVAVQSTNVGVVPGSVG